MANKKSSEKAKEDWMNTKWRPAMGWMYMTVCIFDFIVFPIGFTIVQFWETSAANDAFRQWQPLTLTGAGLFHMAMGAVLGISAWSRGQEKIQGVAGGGMNNVSLPVSYNPSQSGMIQTGYAGNNYQQPYTSTSAYEQSYESISVTPVTAGYKGKKAPVQPADPII